jgi:hypothetical protein|tara:strand:- start:99 stop:293 length:195 start_codon:yes stop_codon:yes gene_type:complete
MNEENYYEFWESDYFIDFLHWVVIAGKPEGSNAEEIIYLVEKPWKYSELWKEYTDEHHNGEYEI